MVQTAPHGELVRNGELKISRFLGTCAEAEVCYLLVRLVVQRTTDNRRDGTESETPPQSLHK